MVLERLARESRGRGRCPVCGEPVEVQLEVILSELPPLKSGKNRGKLIKSKSVRMCARHGIAIYRLVESPPQRQRSAS